MQNSVQHQITRIRSHSGGLDPSSPSIPRDEHGTSIPTPTPTSAMHGLQLLMSLSSSGMHRVILNRLHELPFAEFELALLQLVHAVVTHRCSRTEECLLALRRLLCRLASQSLHLAVKLLWTIEAFAPNADKSRASLEGLRELVEAAAVNGNSITHPLAIASASSTIVSTAAFTNASSSSSSSSSSSFAATTSSAASKTGAGGGTGSNSGNNSFSSNTSGPLSEREEALIHQKMGRASVLNDQRLFFQQLVGISDFLRKIQDRGSRPQQLRYQLLQLSSSILQRKVFMPFASSTERPRWIVRVLPDEAVVFSSRERAPFLLVVETVTSPPTDSSSVLSSSPSPSSSTSSKNHQLPRNSSFNSATNASSSSSGDQHASSSSSSSVTAASGGGVGGLGSSSTCGDPDVREADSLQKIGSAARTFHVYAKKADAEKVKQDPYRESTFDRAARLREYSPYSHLPGWQVESVVVKAGDDLTQEQLALQIIELLHSIWQSAGVPVYALPYRALSVVYDGGVIECINDAMSIDGLKKGAGVQTLHQFFLKQWGDGTPQHAAAQRNFIESMAGYSIACYLMQVKDRHNANLMLTREGHLVHIDFGFMFGTSPGGVSFETAPFKISQELLDTMGGVNSEGFRYFKILLHLALTAVRDKADQLIQLVSVIAPRSGMKCFGTSEAQAKAAVESLKQRLGFHLAPTTTTTASASSATTAASSSAAAAAAAAITTTSSSSGGAAGGASDMSVALYVRELVNESLDNWRTSKYDSFQTWQNGII